MELVSVSLPYEFICKRSALTWREALFGLEQCLISEVVLVNLACAALEAEGDAPKALLYLAGTEAAESARPYAEQLAAQEASQSPQQISRKWLYLVLAWVYEHRDEFPEPLAIVENVYAGFDYPATIAGFVRYMPSDEPDLGSSKLNEERLFRKWKSFLEQESPTFRA